MTKVTIYSTPSCGFCHMAKEYFASHQVAYRNIDVSIDHEAAHEMIHKTGQLGVPVIIVEKDGEETTVVGYNQNELSKLLDIS